MTSGRIQKTNPATGEPLGEFPITDEAGVTAAVARARGAFPAWRDTPVEARLRILGRIREVLRVHQDDFARRISLDTGKPIMDALLTELIPLTTFVDYYAERAPSLLARKRLPSSLLFPGKAAYQEHFAMGVVAVISPWNFPFQLAAVPTLSALIAGNTVVLKPSEVTPLTGEVLRELFDRIGLPRGVVEIVQGDGSTGAALTRTEVDKIFFTGSVATGKRVMAAAAARPIPVELELGGKDAMIVLADANLERAARGAAWGGLVNCGQMCTSVERIFVEERVHDRFVQLLHDEVKRVRVGPPEGDNEMGPLTFAKQREVVESHIADAVKRGATIVHGGARVEGPGQFHEPTLLTGVTPEMTIYREETFGPVLPVVRVRDADEAVRLANDHIYGLNGSVWTSDIEKGLAIASRLECGQVTVNDVVSSVGNPHLPFGGVKQSGFGRYHGPEGLLGFTHTRAILVDRGLLPLEPYWFPYRGKAPLLRGALDALTKGNTASVLWSFVRMLGRSRRR